MGDMIFLVPPVLATLKRRYPDCHITFVTAWGFKEKKRGFNFRQHDFWGKRNQSGFCIALIMTNPHIDQLVHWHDSKTSLTGSICSEDSQSFPTWSRQYYQQQKETGGYDDVFELDFGLATQDNPLKKVYEAMGMSDENYTNYTIYLTDHDKKVAREVMSEFPHPRIVLLEGLEGTTTRGWDPGKIISLEKTITDKYGTAPLWFGGKYSHYYQGHPLSLRQNIATLSYCDVGIGVMSGPLHFAAAVGLPTLTLFCDQPLHRAAPAYFLNSYIKDDLKKHRTLLGPTGNEMKCLKEGTTFVNLTPAEKSAQNYRDWNQPGRQSTKSCLAVVSMDEVMRVLDDMVSRQRQRA